MLDIPPPQDTSKQVSLKGTPQQMQQQCEALHKSDKRAESLKTVFMIGIVVALGVAFFSLMASSSGMFFVGVMLLVGMIVGRVVVGGEDVEDRKLEVARALIDAFADELRHGKQVTLDLDFRGYWQDVLRHNWLSLQATLENGVGLKVDGSIHYKRKSRAKRKYTKIKDKLQERLVVTFTAPKGQQFDPGLQQRIRRGVQAATLRLHNCRVTPKAATFVFATPPVTRVHGRYGWTDTNWDKVLTGYRAVAGVIVSYGLLTSAKAGAEA